MYWSMVGSTVTGGSIEPSQAMALLGFYEKTGLKDWMCTYGVGDHGGGPTKRDLVRSREMNAWPIYPNVKLGEDSGVL